MKKIMSRLVFVPVFFLISCATQPTVQSVAPAEPAPVENPAPSVPATPVPEPEATVMPAPDSENSTPDAVVIQFDTVAITKQTFEHTKSEMQLVVEKLNKITMAKDYGSWLEWLSDEYYQMYSDPGVLETVSASLPIKGIKLKNIRDYFNYVFVPSRQNMRVDDIQFVSPTRVYVIMEITPKSPAAIYILEKYGSGWKLVPKNQ